MIVDDEFEFYETDEEQLFFLDYPIESVEATSYPDPFFIAAVTCLFCIIVFGLLVKLTATVFGSATTEPSLTKTTLQNAARANSNEDQSWDGQCRVSPQFPSKIRRWCDLITQYSSKHDLNPDLVAALIWLESGGNELAYSHSGAVGLMQIMPRDGIAAGFNCPDGPCFKDRPSSDELRDPEFNIAYGTRFLAGLVRRNGNLREALKAYGPMDAGYTYSDKVLSIFNRYRSN